MKYDDVSWHTEGEFPRDLPSSSAATHIGIFTAWAWLRGLGGTSFHELIDEVEDILEQRSRSPGELIIDFCDGKLTDEDLSDEGNGFAVAYYEDDRGYIADYEQNLLRDFDSVYRVPDNWSSYSVMEPVLDHRFREWKEQSGSVHQ